MNLLKTEPETVTAPQQPTFEAAMTELESIVTRLEKGTAPLDESLAGFQRGVELAQLCGRLLNEAERKVELLTMDETGRAVLKPFEPATSR